MLSTPVGSGFTLADLVNEWRQLMRAAQEPGISDTDRRALSYRADEVLNRLAETPTSAEPDAVSGRPRE
jgi:hypothetical protein